MKNLPLKRYWVGQELRRKPLFAPKLTLLIKRLCDTFDKILVLHEIFIKGLCSGWLYSLAGIVQLLC